MDNLDALLSKVSPSQKSKKAEDKDAFKSNKHAAVSSLKSKPVKHGPPSPVFKPQESPKDLPPEFLLPTSEISSDDNDDLDFIKDFKKAMSCPADTQLNIWVSGQSNDLDEFQMIDENDGGEAFALNDDTNSEIEEAEERDKVSGSLLGALKPIGGSKKMDLERDLFSPKRAKNPQPVPDMRRFRSQSENLTACTIFKFLENRTLMQN